VIYLASPYSDPDPRVREERFHAACRAAAELMRAGKLVFSPIAHTHPIVKYGLPKGWEFWQAYDREHLEACEEVLVLMLDGWMQSVGVLGEIRIAEELGKPVSFISPQYAEEAGMDL